MLLLYRLTVLQTPIISKHDDNMRPSNLLSQIDLEKVYAAAFQKGYDGCEIYAEARFQMTARLQGRIEDVQLSSSMGISIHCSNGKSVDRFSTFEISTGGLLKLLGANKNTTTEVISPYNTPFQSVKPRMLPLSSILRSVVNESDSVKSTSLRYFAEVRYFETASEGKSIGCGQEESAECELQWTIAKEGGGLEHFSRTKTLGSIERFQQELLESAEFIDSVRRSLKLGNPWPAPHGEIPVAWSARALAKLCLQFLRGFEGDLVLRNLSFLNDLTLPLAIAFTFEDLAGDTERDHEGSPTRPMVLFKDGRPKGLAVNRRLAEELAVKTTGHCRRESFETAPTVGLWATRLRPETTRANLLSEMPWGVSVQDLEVLSFNAQTAEIRLRLTELFLIHHGAEGESVAPVEVRMNLITLLERLSHFSEDSRTEGFQITKNHQRFLTEVNVPSAISRPISLYGSVPANHYW